MHHPTPDAETAAFLSQLAAMASGETAAEPTVGQRRAALAWMAEAYGPDVAEVAEFSHVSVPGPGGALGLRIYRPLGAPRPRPIVVHMHGGGWVLGGFPAYDRICRAYCSEGDCIVVDVDYRLAPENKFPAALEDCEAALNWVAAHAAELGGDPNRLIVTGDSAGGALAAAVCQRASTPLALQILVYPVMTARAAADFASRRRLGDGRFFLRDLDIRRAEREYLSDPAQGDDPAVSPLEADDGALVRQPASLIIAAGLDPLRDEAELYAKRLKGSGVAVEHLCVEGAIHGFVLFAGAFTRGRETLTLIGERIRATPAVS